MKESKALATTQEVTQLYKKGKRILADEGTKEKIAVRVMEVEAPSWLTVKLGLTLNRGNYESIRADVSTTIPHYEEEKDDAFLYALKETERRLMAVLGDENAVSDLYETAKEAFKNG